MDSDFGSRKRPSKSLRESLDESAAETQTDQTENFRTPEQVAADETVASSVPAVDLTLAPAKDKKPKTSLRDRLNLNWPPGRKEYALIAAVVLLLAAGGWLLLGGKEAKPIAKTQVKKVVKAALPATVPSTLSGRQVEPTANTRPVIGVMIENSLNARPQSGLSEAGVVFEAVAEGGITRFLALYQDTAPGNIGPIRSARPYYLEWALGFDAAYAHVGGSPEALAAIKNWGVRDLDQFANAGAYRREASRPAPHNVYSTVDGLTQLAVGKGYASSAFTGFTRKTEPTKKSTASNKKQSAKEAAQPDSQPTAKAIDLALSGSLYNVRYDYDANTNAYNRSEGGAPHTDANNNKQLSPKVVVAMVTPYSLNGKYSVYQVVGSGPVTIFQDGKLTTGTWTKADQKSQITFTDAAGKAIGLNPGQTWLTAVSDPSKITYSP